MRPIEALINTDDPGIEVVKAWVKQATQPVEILPAESEAGRRSILALQVTTRSPMGAIAYDTGGILIDHGWVRVLGSGHPRLPRSIDAWNKLDSAAHRLQGAILIADDAVGGFFAVNGGGLSGEPGHVFYHAPDSLDWEDVAESYSEWLVGMLTGNLAEFYAGQRWDRWREDAESLPGDRAYSIYPYLFTEGPPIEQRSRKSVPIEELWSLYAGDPAHRPAR